AAPRPCSRPCRRSTRYAQSRKSTHPIPGRHSPCRSSLCACWSPVAHRPLRCAASSRTATRPATRSTAAAIRRNTLVRQPQPFGRGSALPEHVDRNTATRVPEPADAEPARAHLVEQALADADRHVLVEAAVIAERAEEQLEALRFDDPLFLRVVDHQV